MTQVNPDQSKTISVDATGFNGNLTPADDTIQMVADKFDSLTAVAFPADQILVVPQGLTDVANGNNLIATYATAVGKSPTYDNQILIIVPPGTYDFGAQTLNRTADYVHLLGSGVCRNRKTNRDAPWDGPFSYPATIITGSADDLIIDTMRYSTMKGFLLHQETVGKHHIRIDQANGADGAAYIDIGLTNEGSPGYGIYAKLINQNIASYFEQVHAATTRIGALWDDAEFSGTCIDCTAWQDSFGAAMYTGTTLIDCSGTFLRCYCKNNGFGIVKGGGGSMATFSGYARDCMVNTRGFGASGGGRASTFSGTAINCKVVTAIGFASADHNTSYNCVFSGTAIDCHCSQAGFGGFGEIVTGAKLIRCTNTDDHASVYAWGRAGMSGYMEDCIVLGSKSMVDPFASTYEYSTGTMVGCTIPDRTYPLPKWRGTVRRCSIKSTRSCFAISGSDYTIFDECTLVAGASASYYPIEGSYYTKITYCKMNKDVHSGVNNRISFGYNVIDSDMSIG